MKYNATYLQRIDHLIRDPFNIDVLQSALHMHPTLAMIMEQVWANQQLEQTTQELNDCIWVRLAEIWRLATANQIGLLQILLYNDIYFRLALFINADGTFTPWLSAESRSANPILTEPIQSIPQSVTIWNLTLDPYHPDRWSHPDTSYLT